MSINIQETFQKMPLGEKIILPAALVLLIDSFLPWYHAKACFLDVCASVSRNGWESPGALWSILAVLLGLAMGVVIALTRFTQVQLPALPQGVTWPRVYLGAGAAAALFVLIKLINESSHLSIGFFIGIICVIALVAGGYLLFQTERAGGGAASTTSSM
ncbi:MAG TPA: hypothetical protein VMT90_07040 [Dehalococcoidia bacterium]|jgi:hypothetical protein|nr:hypothetical protein [Dehalococcoidia bacterium]